MKKATITLSSGHDPKDNGAASYGRNEYTEAVKLNTAVAKILRQCGHTVHLTNRSDAGGTTPTHAARAINATNPDVTIETHFNAFSGTAGGTESYYWHTSAKGKRLAQLLCEHITQAIGTRNRGAKPYSGGERGVAIVRDTKAPANLLEALFLDNKEEAAKLADTTKLATAMADAIEQWIKETL